MEQETIGRGLVQVVAGRSGLKPSEALERGLALGVHPSRAFGYLTTYRYIPADERPSVDPDDVCGCALGVMYVGAVGDAATALARPDMPDDDFCAGVARLVGDWDRREDDHDHGAIFFGAVSILKQVEKLFDYGNKTIPEIVAWLRERGL